METSSFGTLNNVVRSVDQQGSQSVASLVRELIRVLRADSCKPAVNAYADLLGVLGIEIESRLDVWENRLSRFRMGGTFTHMSRFLDRSIEGMTCLEIGAGSMNPLGAVFVGLLLGAARGIAVDLDPPQDYSISARALARCASYALLDPRLLCQRTQCTSADVLRSLQGFDLRKLLQGDLSGIDEKRLVLKRESALRMSIDDGDVDFLMSTSFLEHVVGMPALLEEMRRVLKPGGTMVHSIDGVDHRTYGDPSIHPLAFLALPSEQSIVFECNRIRPLAFASMFAESGFDIVNIEVHQSVELGQDILSSFDPAFRDMPREHLEITRATIHARKEN